jgi:hypothetical protein
VLTQTLPTGKLSSPSATRTSATLAHREPQRATGELFITSTKAQRRHALRGLRTGLTSNPFHPARTNHTVGDEAEQTDSNGKDTQRPCGHRSRPLTYARADRAEDNTTNTTNTHSSNTNRLQKSSVGSTNDKHKHTQLKTQTGCENHPRGGAKPSHTGRQGRRQRPQTQQTHTAQNTMCGSGG